MNKLPEVRSTACSGMESQLAELLLDEASAPEKVRAHVAGCKGCSAGLEELRATMLLLDQWQAPEPNPFFMTRMEALLQEERAAAPRFWVARWWQQLHDNVVLGSGAGVRPLAAMAMSLMLLVGGGTYMGLTNLDQQKMPAPQESVVSDLQTMDSNAQLLDQLDAMDKNDDGDITTN